MKDLDNITVVGVLGTIAALALLLALVHPPALSAAIQLATLIVGILGGYLAKTLQAPS